MKGQLLPAFVSNCCTRYCNFVIMMNDIFLPLCLVYKLASVNKGEQLIQKQFYLAVHLLGKDELVHKVVAEAINYGHCQGYYEETHWRPK